MSLSSTRLAAIALDRSVNGRVERFYKNGELVMERRIPSDYLLTWLLARLDPLRFGSPTAKALAAATGDPHDAARNSLPKLLDNLTDIAPEDCSCAPRPDISTLAWVRWRRKSTSALTRKSPPGLARARRTATLGPFAP